MLKRGLSKPKPIGDQRENAIVATIVIVGGEPNIEIKFATSWPIFACELCLLLFVISVAIQYYLVNKSIIPTRYLFANARTRYRSICLGSTKIICKTTITQTLNTVSFKTISRPCQQVPFHYVFMVWVIGFAGT